MRMLKRWVSCVATNFDWVLAQVENHEALVDSAIREMQAAGGKARVQLARVKRDGEAMRQRLVQYKEQEQAWTERAIRLGVGEQEKAIECLRRKRALELEIASLEKQSQEHSRLETQLTADLKHLSSRIEELKRKKNTMTARQYRAEAIRAGQTEDIALISELGDIFERWEGRLAEAETINLAPEDSLEAELRSEEQQAQLKAELAELLAQNITA
jgi:phage shock protein A